MSESSFADRRPSRDLVLESVADATRRDALAVLQGQTGPVPVAELATGIAALRTGTDVADVTHADRKPVAVALVHVHLPTLEAAGLVAWEPGDDVVATIDRAAIDDRRLREVVSVDADDWDAVLRALADSRRRLALSILEDADGSVERVALARRVVARETGVSPSRVPDRELEAVRVRLRHSHLPTLRDAGLISVAGEKVVFEGHRELETDWLTSTADTGDRGDRATADAGEPRSVDGNGSAITNPRTPLDEADD